MNETFSVILLLYNNSEFLPECLDSVLSQDYPAVEIIVVDDGSKVFDKTGIEDYINAHKRENIRNVIVYQNECNLGTVKSANGAIRKASGRYLKLLAGDDALYDCESLSHAAAALRACPCGIITGDVMRCDQDMHPIGRYHKNLVLELNSLSPIDVFRRLCIHNDIVAGGVFFDAVFFKRYGMFDESYRLLEDWPTWMRATKRGCRIFYTPFYTIKYRSHNGIGTSTNPIYLADRKRLFLHVIVPARKKIGPYWFLLAGLSFLIINSILVRKIYGFLFRRN
jgi:glycosyltransferase involved in cell wall biosynthesis